MHVIKLEHRGHYFSNMWLCQLLLKGDREIDFFRYQSMPNLTNLLTQTQLCLQM